MHILKSFSLCNYLGITGKTKINFFLCCLQKIEIGHELKKKLSVACEWSVAFFGYHILPYWSLEIGR
jgi:hypothetical protein